MLRSALSALIRVLPAPMAEAHCDGPCGVYDPASARVAAEAVLSMTKKLKAMEAPAAGDAAALAAFNNTFGRYVAIKEEEAQKTKELRSSGPTTSTGYLATFPDLHDTFWKAADRRSGEHRSGKAEELMAAVEKIHGMFGSPAALSRVTASA